MEIVVIHIFPGGVRWETATQESIVAVVEHSQDTIFALDLKLLDLFSIFMPSKSSCRGMKFLLFSRQTRVFKAFSDFVIQITKERLFGTFQSFVMSAETCSERG